MLFLKIIGALYATILAMNWFMVVCTAFDNKSPFRRQIVYCVKGLIVNIPWPWVFCTMTGRDYMRSLYYDLLNYRVVDRHFERSYTAVQ